MEIPNDCSLLVETFEHLYRPSERFFGCLMFFGHFEGRETHKAWWLTQLKQALWEVLS